MDDGAALFIFIGLGIGAFALLIARLFRRTLNRQMPGRDGRNTSIFWYGAGGRLRNDDFDGGTGGD